MGQVHDLSISRDHWVLDNAYSSLDIQDQFSSDRDVDLVNQQVRFEDNFSGTNIPKFTKSKSEFDYLRRGDIQIEALIPVYKKFKIYTKNTKTWKGVITKITNLSFACRLYDLDDRSEVYETAEFIIDSIISDEDKPLLEVGAIFYWSVGSIIRNGTKKNQSEIRLRRIAAMDVEEFNDFYDKSQSNYSDLKWD
ncbi:hypothetical protein [Flavobacterium sp. KBS0721]|uniref:hypothetical protein n=1 Tax=Flavobacterium sp. KBS0721 TaxID=1179672 RepID=UPI00098F41FF|nr:hypothetical protein [Flavobacterium sp. KBS0721]QDW20359.1 hypothetical protein B0M43_0009645 [Flavobacterium sp. KBS0721]